jgi:hypothetical protein
MSMRSAASGLSGFSGNSEDTGGGTTRTEGSDYTEGFAAPDYRVSPYKGDSFNDNDTTGVIQDIHLTTATTTVTREAGAKDSATGGSDKK